MDVICKAQELYIKKFNQDNRSSQGRGGQSFDQDIQRFITIAVKTVPSVSDLFNNKCVFVTLIDALLVCVNNGVGVKTVANAYRYMEKYFFLLLQQPWKPEYRTLKMYGGFYKTKVKSVLCEAEIIFATAGYVEKPDNTMVYNRDVNQSQLLILSFDCFIASGICDRIHEQHNQQKAIGGTLDNAITDLLKESWLNVKASEEMLARNYSSEVIGPPEIPKREPVHNVGNSKMAHKTVYYPQEPSPVYDLGMVSTDPEQYLGNFKFKPNSDSHIPYMDEAEHYPKLSEGTVEEHVRESLKLAKEQQDSVSEWKNIQDALPKSSNMDSAIVYPPSKMSHMYYQSGVIPAPTFTLSKSVFSDQGYGSGSPNQSPAYNNSGQDMISETIYLPPNVKQMNNALPPAIPPRELKPCYDMVDGLVGSKYTGGRTITQPSKVAIPPSSDNTATPLSALAADRNLSSRLSLHQMKSKSLKSEPKNVILDNRGTKSLDFNYPKWKCPMCDSVNSSLAPNCLQCSYNPRLSETETPANKKSCPSCTFLNDFAYRDCMMCGAALP